MRDDTELAECVTLSKYILYSERDINTFQWVSNSTSNCSTEQENKWTHNALGNSYIKRAINQLLLFHFSAEKTNEWSWDRVCTEQEHTWTHNAVGLLNKPRYN